MGGELLLDTGALVGLLDKSQSVHQACAGFFRTWTGNLASTEAVLTESMHVLSGVKGGSAACIDFILKGGVFLIPSTEISLRRCRTLIEKYDDLPMDFADATLVVLAEELNTDLIFTVDRDFQVYRIHGKKHFRIFPEF